MRASGAVVRVRAYAVWDLPLPDPLGVLIALIHNRAPPYHTAYGTKQMGEGRLWLRRWTVSCI